MISEIFTTSKYDNKIAATDGANNYTFADLKRLIASEINFLKDKKENVVILSGDNFSFIIQFFASLFCNKNIYLVTDRARLKNIDFDYDIVDGYVKEPDANFEYKSIDIAQPRINFYTSGTSGSPKIIKKSLHNLIREAQDIGDEFGLKDLNLTVASTTTMCHLFGLTFHLMTPLCNGLIIDTQTVSYPENVDKDDMILVSTPTFLSTVTKFDIPFKTAPKYIISAGSKLDEKVFEYLEQNSNIIEIYGSTETGVMAHKTHHSADFELFKNVDLNTKKDCAEVVCDYFYGDKVTINDNIELRNRNLIIKNRTDRLFKIYDKRVCADELEKFLTDNDFVNNCYITKQDDKLVCLCALSSIGQEYLLENGVSDLTKFLKQYLKDFSEIIPQKWKYIDEIPMTEAGKTDKNLIEHLFEVNLSLPVLLDRTFGENNIIYKIFFYNQCNFFKGHFPDFKLVPGVLQLYLAKEFANIHFGLELGQGQWKRIKFSNIIKPDSIVNLKLEYNRKQVTYEFYAEDKKYSSGSFLCENIYNPAQGLMQTLKEVKNETC